MRAFLTLLLIIRVMLLDGAAQSPAEPPPPPDERERAAEDFQKRRENAILLMDAGASLDLLARTLAATGDAQVQAALMRGMLSGLEGRRNVSAPEGWIKLSATLSKSANADVSGMTQRLGQIFGDKAATGRALATLRDPAAAVTERRAALKSLLTQRNPEVTKALEALLEVPALRLDAIRAYSAMENERAPGILLARYPDLDFQGRRAVVETLAMRKSYASALLAAIESEVVPRQDVPAYIARSLGEQLGDQFTSVYGDIAALSKDKEELVAKYRRVLTPAALAKADAGAGRAVFQRTCAACHVLYGDGGKIGPELTGSNRADLDYILLNMLDPSGDIPDAYKLVSITTKNGQLLAGTIAEEDDQRVVLNMVGQQSVVVKSDIQSREVSAFSMMPEGLLTTLQDAEVLDLVKYLQTREQVEMEVDR